MALALLRKKHGLNTSRHAADLNSSEKSPLDASIHPFELWPNFSFARGSNAYFNSRGIIDACKPYEWIDEFPEAITTSPEWEAKVKGRWGSTLDLKGGRKIW